jgi:hypothetical protein
MSEYNHNEIVSSVYQNLEDQFEGADIVARKDGKEINLGELNVQRRHWDGKKGAPDIVVELRRFSLYGERFDTIPFALFEVEESISAAERDLENFVDGQEDRTPTVIVTDGESRSTRIQKPGAHIFDVKGIDHDDLEL